MHDAYKSIVEAFIHAGAVNDCKVNIEWIHSEELNEENVQTKLKDLHCILVAPGFGHRGIRTYSQYSFLWYLFRNANGCHRIRA